MNALTYGLLAVEDVISVELLIAMAIILGIIFLIMLGVVIFFAVRKDHKFVEESRVLKEGCVQVLQGEYDDYISRKRALEEWRRKADAGEFELVKDGYKQVPASAEIVLEGYKQVPIDVQKEAWSAVTEEMSTEAPAKESYTSEDREELAQELADIEIIEREGEYMRAVKSFSAKLIQSDDVLKQRYSDIKNFLLSYSGVTARTSWKRESFHVGRKCIARMLVRGKTLCLYIAGDPSKYDAKFRVEDVSAVASHADTPCLCRLKNDARDRGARKVIADALAGVAEVDKTYVKHNYKMPYETTDALVEKELVKLVKAKPFNKD